MNILSPLYIFSILGILILIVYLVYNFLIFYHLVRFGIGTQPKAIGALFTFGSMFIFAANVILFLMVDFTVLQSQLIKLFSSLFTGSYL